MERHGAFLKIKTQHQVSVLLILTYKFTVILEKILTSICFAFYFGTRQAGSKIHLKNK